MKRELLLLLQGCSSTCKMGQGKQFNEPLQRQVWLNTAVCLSANDVLLLRCCCCQPYSNKLHVYSYILTKYQC